tara:strand:+ start:10712 stop:12592 length:1881 start_codon:yes stop_codon:yes gene_type:complete
MATIKIRRGTTASSSTVVPALGEPVWDSGTNVLKIGDGSAQIQNLTAIGATAAGTVNTSGSPVDNDFAKFTDADTIEGRSASETRTDLGLVIGTNVQAYDANNATTSTNWSAADITSGTLAVARGGTALTSLTTLLNSNVTPTSLGLVIGTNVLAQQSIGISDNNLVEVDDSDVASGDFAKFTSNGLQGRSAAETLSDIGATSNSGTVTSVGTNTGLSGTVTSSGNLSLALGDLADGSAAVVGSADKLIYLDNGVQKSKHIDDINLGQFNNDQSWTANAGTVTGVGVGTGLDSVGTAASPTLSVDVSDFMTNGANNRLVTATGTDAMNSEANLTFDGSKLVVSGNLDVTGDLTITGASSSIDVQTLNVEDSWINIDKDNTSTDVVDGGISLLYDLGMGDMYSGFYRDASANTLHFFKNSTVVPGASATFSPDGDAGQIATGEWRATDVAVAYGGTGASTASAARTNLGLVIGTDVQAYDANNATTSTNWSAADITSGTLAVARGGTGLTSISTLLNSNVTPTSLGLVIGTNVQAYDANNATTSTNWAASDITSGTLAVARGGTGLTSLSTLLNSNVTPTSLGLVIGTNVQAYNATLGHVAGGTYVGDDHIVTVGTVTTGTIDGQTF